MIKLILNHLLTKKNKLFLISYLIIVCLIILINIPIKEVYYLVYLNKEYYIIIFNDITKELYKILFIIFTTVISIDHFNGYINNITTYKNRTYIITYKFISYIYLIFINTLILIFVYFLIPILFKFDFFTNKEFIKYILYLSLDNIIILLLILLFVRNNNKIVAYIFMVIYIFLSLIDINSYYLFYLIPILSYKYIDLNYYYIYIFTYIIVLFYLNIFNIVRA